MRSVPGGPRVARPETRSDDGWVCVWGVSSYLLDFLSLGSNEALGLLTLVGSSPQDRVAEAAPERVKVKAKADALLLGSEDRDAAAPGCRGLLAWPGGVGAPQPLFPATGTSLAAGVVLARGWSSGGRVRGRLLFADQGVAGDFSHYLQARLLGPGGQEEALEARGVGQQEEGPEAQGDEAREEEKEEELLRQPQPPRGGRDETRHFPHEHRGLARGWGQSAPAGPRRPPESRHLSARVSAKGGRRGAPPGMGVPESFAASGNTPEGSSESLGRVLPCLPGHSGLGGARASRAARLGARARKGQPRAAAFPPAAAQPSSQRPESAGPAPSRAAAAAGTVTCRPRRRGCRRGRAPAGLVPAPSRPQSLGPKFPPKKQFPEGSGSGVEVVAGLECQPHSESAPTLPGRDSARAQLSGHVHNFAPTRSGHRAEGGGTSEPAATGSNPAPRERRDARTPVRSRAQCATSRGGVAAAAPRSAGSHPANSVGLRVPAGITCSRPPPAPRSAQPRLRLPRCSWRPRSGRSRRAAAAAG